MIKRKETTAMKDHHSDASPAEILAPIEGPELVFGLVGALGSNLTEVTKVLTRELFAFFL